MQRIQETTADSGVVDLRGRTIEWTFDDGPTAGTPYQHRIGQDSSISFRQRGTPTWTRAVAGGVVARRSPIISYLSPHGYTLTAVLEPHSRRVFAVASKDDEWHEQSGSFRFVETAAVPSAGSAGATSTPRRPTKPAGKGRAGRAQARRRR